MTNTEVTIIAYISGNDELNNAAQAVFTAQYEIEHSDCTGPFETELITRLYDGFVYQYANTIEGAVNSVTDGGLDNDLEYHRAYTIHWALEELYCQYLDKRLGY